MCGPPPFGELRVLTRGIRFTFFKAQESCHHKIFWLGARRATNFFRKKIRCFFLSPNCRNLRTRAWEVARLLLAGTFLTARGVAFPNTLSDLSISSRNNSTVPRPTPFPTATHRMLLLAASSSLVTRLLLCRWLISTSLP